MPNQLIDVAVTSSWVFPENVQPLLAALSWFIDYELDDNDWTAIEQGYSFGRTNRDQDIWFDYPLIGTPPLEVGLSSEPEADPVSIRVRSDRVLSDRLRVQIETALVIFQAFVDRR